MYLLNRLAWGITAIIYAAMFLFMFLVDRQIPGIIGSGRPISGPMAFCIGLSHFLRVFKWVLLPLVYGFAFLTDMFVRWYWEKFADS